MLIAPRQFCTPWVWCSMPRAWSRKLVFAVPHHSAAWRMARSEMPGDRRGAGGRPFRDAARHVLEARRAGLDEGVIEPVVLDHEVEDAGEEGRVAPGLDGQEEVAGTGQGREARVDHDHASAVARAPARRSRW